MKRQEFPSGSLLSRLWEAAIDEVRDLETYSGDWDGQGAEPVPAALIHRAINMLLQIRADGGPAPTAIYPAADGTIFLEWHDEEGWTRIVSIRRKGKLSDMTIGPDGTRHRTSVPTAQGAEVAVFCDPGDEGEFTFFLAA